jgi:hypothetical protein
MTYPTTIVDSLTGTEFSAKRVARYHAALETLAAAVAQGNIPNVTYNETKETLNRLYDDAWDKIHNYESGGLIYLHPACHTLNSVAKALAKVPATTPHHAELTAFLAEIKPAIDAMNWLKGKDDAGNERIVKRLPKAPEDVQAKYLAPRASGTAARLVQDALIEVTTKAYDRLLANITDAYESHVTCYLTLRDEAVAKNPKGTGYQNLAPYRLFSRYAVEAKHIAELAVDRDGELHSDWQARVGARAKKDADFIRDQFVIKNLSKLDSIVDAKASTPTVTVQSYSLNLCSLEGTLLVTFPDGSRFSAKNQVVWGTSNRGNPFQRFPLTFHDVLLPGGVKMGKPCEERMNTVFVGKPET